MADNELILCYHAVSEQWPSPTAVTAEDFAAQLGVLARRGYRGATFFEVAHGALAGRVVAVTFDDAHASVYRYARPVLDSLGWPATVFVPTRHVELGERLVWEGSDLWANTPWVHDLECMRWQQLAKLAAQGWEIGSHTRSHPNLPRLPEEQLLNELVGSRADVEEALGLTCRSVAYPYGLVDARVVAGAETAGYLAGAATLRGVDGAMAMARPRLVVSRGDSARRFAVKSRPLTRRLLAHHGVARAKARLQSEERSA